MCSDLTILLCSENGFNILQLLTQHLPPSLCSGSYLRVIICPWRDKNITVAVEFIISILEWVVLVTWNIRLIKLPSYLLPFKSHIALYQQIVEFSQECGHSVVMFHRSVFVFRLPLVISVTCLTFNCVIQSHFSGVSDMREHNTGIEHWLLYFRSCSDLRKNMKDIIKE